MDSEAEGADLAARKVVYLTYAEQFKKRLDLCRKAGIQSALAVGRTEQESAELLCEARRLWNEPVEGFEPADALIRTQGPAVVVESVDKASTGLTGYRSVVYEAISADEGSREQRVYAARAAYGPVYRTYLEFLHVASDAVGDDDLLRLGH